MHARLSSFCPPFVLSLFFCGQSIFGSECCDYLLLDDVSESQGLHPLQVTNDLTRLEICQKIYRTEDFRVKNLHRKRVIFDIC